MAERHGREPLAVVFLVVAREVFEQEAGLTGGRIELAPVAAGGDRHLWRELLEKAGLTLVDTQTPRRVTRVDGLSRHWVKAPVGTAGTYPSSRWRRPRHDSSSAGSRRGSHVSPSGTDP